MKTLPSLFHFFLFDFKKKVLNRQDASMVVIAAGTNEALGSQVYKTVQTLSRPFRGIFFYFSFSKKIKKGIAR